MAETVREATGNPREILSFLPNVSGELLHSIEEELNNASDDEKQAEEYELDLTAEGLVQHWLGAVMDAWATWGKQTGWLQLDPTTVVLKPPAQTGWSEEWRDWQKAYREAVESLVASVAIEQDSLPNLLSGIFWELRQCIEETGPRQFADGPYLISSPNGLLVVKSLSK